MGRMKKGIFSEREPDPQLQGHRWHLRSVLEPQGGQSGGQCVGRFGECLLRPVGKNPVGCLPSYNSRQCIITG